jgi:hypothetical protein
MVRHAWACLLALALILHAWAATAEELQVDLRLPSSTTDTDLAASKDKSQLKRLHLSHTLVTDAGLSHLKEMHTLSYLDLDYTQVTDAGLAYLKDLVNAGAFSA